MEKLKENFCGLTTPCAGDIDKWCNECEYLNKLLNRKEPPSSVSSSAGLDGFITVPRDPRTKKAQVTSKMKAICIGEFSFEREVSYVDEEGNYDDGLEKITVPWTTVKEIYKAMVRAAERTAA